MGRICIAENTPICKHADGSVVRFDLEGVMAGRDCRMHLSPSTVVALPLATHGQQLGAIVFARAKAEAQPVSLPEMTLMAGIARQLGVSIQNTQLTRLAQERERTLADLLNQVVGAQEAERQRIARDLHDATAQSLSAIAMGLRGTANSVYEQAPAAYAQLAAVQNFATEALGELRRIMADLRPPQLDDLGLAASLRWYVGAFQQRNPGIDTTLNVIGDAVRLPASREMALFRVAQEALTNIAKHAHATRASVLVETKPERVVVTVQDNGRGFDTARVLGRRDGAANWGLLGMRERTLLLGGDYEIKSAPGQGTLVRVSVPVTREETPVRG
jgi:signal transduction histidine kinase